MKNIIYFSLLFLSLTIGTTLFAQSDTVIVYLDFADATEDPLVEGGYLIPVKVENYDSVAGYQIEVTPVTPGATYIDDGFENSLFDPPSFDSNINGSTLVTIYTPLTGDPTNTLEDGTVLFNLHVLLDGEPGDCFLFEIEAVTVAPSGAEELPTTAIGGEYCIVAFIQASGNVSGPEGSPMSGVLIDLVTADSVYTDTTDLSGNFQFSGIDAGEPFEVTPTARVGAAEQANRIAGLNVADAIAIRRHILQLAPIENPLALLSTDVVANEAIDIMDLVSLVNFVLLRNDLLPVGAYYRFLPAGFSFEDEMNPWADNPPASLQNEGSNEDVNDLNFTGLKFGDVNFSSY